MTTTECIEIIASADSGGQFNDEMRVNPGFLVGVLNAGRALVIRERYAKSQTIHPNFKQLVYPKFVSENQEDNGYCYTVFNLERAIDVNDIMDGYISCGPYEESNVMFKRLKSRSQHASLLIRGIGKAILARDTHWLPDPATGTLFVYPKGQDKVKQIKYEIVAEDPTTVEGFSIEKDDYPITNDALKRVEEMVRQGTIYGYLKVKSNKVSNSQDDAQIAVEQ